MAKNKRKAPAEDAAGNGFNGDYVPLDGGNGQSKKIKAEPEEGNGTTTTETGALVQGRPSNTRDAATSAIAPPPKVKPPPDPLLALQLATLDAALTSVFTTISTNPSIIDNLPAPQRNFLQTIHGLSTAGQTPWLSLPKSFPQTDATPPGLPPLPPVRNQNLLNQVFTHVSLLGTQGDVSASAKTASTLDRLEFIGDSYIHTALTRILYDRYPLANEGVLTSIRDQLVNNASLSAISMQYGLHKRLRVAGSFSEEDSKGRYGGRNKAYADVLEAYLGAAVIDAENEAEGLRLVREWAEKAFAAQISAVPERKSEEVPLDNTAKHRLFNIVVKVPKSGGKLWYAEGPPKQGMYVALCMFDGYGMGQLELARGKGQSKKIAEMRAAMDALKKKKLLDRIVAARIKSDPEAAKHMEKPPGTVGT